MAEDPEKPRRTSLKEWSETVRNAVSTIAVIVGGAWVLYQWDTLFPKTQADVFEAAASIRTDVTGTVTAHFGGVLFDGPIYEQAELANRDCQKRPGAGERYLPVPISFRLAFASASRIPVRIEIDRVDLIRARIGTQEIRDGAPPAPFEALPISASGLTLREDDFLGGLSWSRIEQGGAASTAFVTYLNLPFTCDPATREWHPPGNLTFAVQARILGINPATGDLIGAGDVAKVFVTSCRYLDFDPVYDCTGEPLVAQ